MIDTLEIVPYEIRYIMEREWTVALRENGHDLLNVNAGASISQKIKDKIADAHRGRPLPEGARRKIGDAHRGRSTPFEVRKKMSDTQRERLKSPEARARMIEAARLREEKKRIERKNKSE
jgi:hypothetical protein